MTKATFIVLNKSNYTKHRNNVHGARCIHCGRRLEPGETAVSKLVGVFEDKTYYKQRALYCLSCADILCII